MQIYLPIAELPVNVLLVFAMGIAVGFVSGMFGIGGGFLMTPLLIFIGISPAVAVATVSTHIAASSFSGAIAYWRRRALDLPLAVMLLAGGFVGTGSGVWLFTQLRALGQLDLTIGLSYLLLLGAVGTLMVVEGLRAILREHVRLANLFTSWVEADPEWELVAPQRFSLVVFRRHGTDEENEELLRRVNETGEMFISHTKLGGRYVLRLAIGNARTTEADVRRAWDVLNKEARR